MPCCRVTSCWCHQQKMEEICKKNEERKRKEEEKKKTQEDENK